MHVTVLCWYIFLMLVAYLITITVSPEQDNDAEIDRLVDGGDLTYYDMAEACLTNQRINDQPLLSTNAGLYYI